MLFDKMAQERRLFMLEKRPFGIRDKIGYMFGDFGNDFSFLFASNYLMVFYTKVLGISGFAVGLLFLGARIKSIRWIFPPRLFFL